jgi:hypothetical protein
MDIENTLKQNYDLVETLYDFNENIKPPDDYKFITTIFDKGRIHFCYNKKSEQELLLEKKREELLQQSKERILQRKEREKEDRERILKEREARIFKEKVDFRLKYGYWNCNW